MNEVGPKPKAIDQIRAEFERAKSGTTERHLMSANEALESIRAAVLFFELGLKLGRETPADVENLVSEINTYLAERNKQIQEQVFPRGGTNVKRGG